MYRWVEDLLNGDVITSQWINSLEDCSEHSRLNKKCISIHSGMPKEEYYVLYIEDSGGMAVHHKNILFRLCRVDMD